jgi:hypothetical protein
LEVSPVRQLVVARVRNQLTGEGLLIQLNESMKSPFSFSEFCKAISNAAGAIIDEVAGMQWR